MHKDLILSMILTFMGGMCLAVQPAITAPPAEMELHPFYAKYMDCDGIPVISSEKVDDQAFYRLKQLLDKMLENRPDLRQTLVDEGFRYIIIAHEEQVTDVPDYAHMRPKAFWDQRARGFGGRTTSCGEENLLNLQADRYADESIFIHELAHGMHSPGLRKCEPNFQQRLEALYQKAMDKGLYKNDYASTNAAEYWAEGVQAFFDCDRENNWNHNHINTREELIAYDPEMAAFIREIFRITDENDWRFEPLHHHPSVEKTPVSLDPNGRFPKYIWILQFSVFGTEKADDAAMIRAAQVVRDMFRYRFDMLKTMIDQDVALVVEGPNADTPDNLKVEDFVQEEDGKPAANLPQKLRITVASNDLSGSDDEVAKSNLIHEMALAAYYYNGLRPVDPEYARRRQKQQFEIGLERIDERFDRRVQGLYEKARQKGLWESTPAAENRFEYFAQGVMSFFDASKLVIKGRPVNTREQLIAYDPELAALVEDVFKHPQRTDWRYAMSRP